MSLATRNCFCSLLDERLEHPERRDEFDREIWARFGAVRAILVVDLSGFTRITRARGIVEFLTIHRRAIRIATPIVGDHAGRLIKTEADNILALFEGVETAARCAHSLLRSVEGLRGTVPDDELPQLCMGLGYGRILELEDDFYGDEANVTFKLGEDVARPNEVLITQAAWDSLKDSGIATPVERKTITLGGTETTYFCWTP